MNRLFTIILITLFSVNGFAKYQISNYGKEYIKSYEKCVLTAYWDSNGYSIGYGHHGSDVKKNMVITKSKANAFFNEDIKWVNSAINRLIDNLPVKHNFSQGFIDGLGDLIYNCGEQGVIDSEFYNRLKRCRKNNQNDLNFTIAAVKTMKIKFKGNIRRRYTTHKMMLN